MGYQYKVALLWLLDLSVSTPYDRCCGHEQLFHIFWIILAMGSLTFILSKIRKYEQGFTVVILVILLYLYLINSGYRFRKVDSSIARKPYIRSVNYQCAKSLLKVPYYRDSQIAEFIPRIKFRLYIIVHDTMMRNLKGLQNVGVNAHLGLRYWG